MGLKSPSFLKQKVRLSLRVQSCVQSLGGRGHVMPAHARRAQRTSKRRCGGVLATQSRWRQNNRASRGNATPGKAERALLPLQFHNTDHPREQNIPKMQF